MRALQPVSLNANGSSAWLVLDQYATTPSVRLDLVISGGACTAQVDYTDDDPFQNPWSPSPVTVGGQIVPSTTTSTTVTSTTIPRAVRLTVTAAGGGTATLKVVQQGLQ